MSLSGLFAICSPHPGHVLRIEILCRFANVFQPLVQRHHAAFGLYPILGGQSLQNRGALPAAVRQAALKLGILAQLELTPLQSATKCFKAAASSRPLSSCARQRGRLSLAAACRRHGLAGLLPWLSPFHAPRFLILSAPYAPLPLCDKTAPKQPSLHFALATKEGAQALVYGVRESNGSVKASTFLLVARCSIYAY